jgi:hypothetical protein
MIDRSPHTHRPPAVHAVLGIGIVLVAEVMLRSGNRWVGSYFTPIVWTGYIIFVDAVVATRTGASPLTARRKEFLLLLPISIASWYVFEGVNLLLGNWSYVNLPASRAARWLGYAWSYATITPAIFITAALIDSFLKKRLDGRRPIGFSPAIEEVFFWTGLALFVVTLLFPSPWLCPLPWVSMLLWFEGMNDRRGIGSFGAFFRAGDYSLFVSLLISGAICGLLWETWNFRAATKWHYHVPYLPNVRLFEMPVLGFLGFPPFALECFLMYRLMRWLAPVRLTVDVLGRPWHVQRGGSTP